MLTDELDVSFVVLKRRAMPECSSGGAGMNYFMGVINRILTMITAPFRALGSRSGRRGAGRRGV
jgi:hypothetical protein